MPSSPQRLRCSGCGWSIDASAWLDPRARELPESHMALHLSARPNCLAELREVGKVEWLYLAPLYEFRRCKTIGGGRYGNRQAFAKYRTALTPSDAERLAGAAFEAAARNFAGAERGGEREDGSREEEFPSHSQPGLANDDAFFNAGFDAISSRPDSGPLSNEKQEYGIGYWIDRNKKGSSNRGGRPVAELPAGFVRRNGVVGRMIEVGASGLLLAASGTVRPVKRDDAWRIGFVDSKRGGDRWSGMFEDETATWLAIGDTRFAGRVRAADLKLQTGGLRNGGWRG